MESLTEEVLKEIKAFVETDAGVEAPHKSINFSVYDADPEDVKELIKKRGYRLACVCGSSEETVRIIATTRIKVAGFEIVNTIYSRPTAKEDYLRLRQETAAKY